jgi:thiosulfate dehydrogenase
MASRGIADRQVNLTWRHAVLLTALVVISGVIVSCASSMRVEPGASPPRLTADQAAISATAPFPSGPQGALLTYGRNILVQTPTYAGAYITARMSCAACHPHAGTQAHAGSLVGSYAMFPQWNKRAHRFIALQDRIAECFLYSMNGKPPAYYSREMIALTAYIAWLSRGAPTGNGFLNQGPVAVTPQKPPSAARGAHIYSTRCISCHGATGDGAGAIPPVWGPHSFNDKAGMSKMDRIVPFVKVAMPQNAPGTLTDQEAADVAAFILSHPRPHFDKNRLIEFPVEKAGYF